MKLKLKNRILLLFGFLSILIFSNYFLLLITNDKATLHERWVLHTHTVIESGERLLGYLRGIETGQRGFLLTG